MRKENGIVVEIQPNVDVDAGKSGAWIVWQDNNTMSTMIFQQQHPSLPFLALE